MRNEEIREQLAEELADRESQTREKLREAYTRDKEKYTTDFVNAMDSLFKKCKIKQERKNASGTYESREGAGLGPIKYIWVNCLRVSVETGSYAYGLRAYDKYLFSDSDYAEETYIPGYHKALLEEDKQYIDRLVMSKIIRGKKYEVLDMQKWYIWNNYMRPMPPEIEEAVERIWELESYRELDKAEGIALYYGELMETPDWKYEL